jgi:hypothetical protein
MPTSDEESPLSPSNLAPEANIEEPKCAKKIKYEDDENDCAIFRLSSENVESPMLEEVEIEEGIMEKKVEENRTEEYHDESQEDNKDEVHKMSIESMSIEEPVNEQPTLVLPSADVLQIKLIKLEVTLQKATQQLSGQMLNNYNKLLTKQQQDKQCKLFSENGNSGCNLIQRFITVQNFFLGTSATAKQVSLH